MNVTGMTQVSKSWDTIKTNALLRMEHPLLTIDYFYFAETLKSENKLSSGRVATMSKQRRTAYML